MIACNLNEALYFCVRILMETPKERRNRRTGGETTTTCSDRNFVVAAIGTNFVIRMFRFLLSSMVCRMAITSPDAAVRPGLSKTHSRNTIAVANSHLILARYTFRVPRFYCFHFICFPSTSANANILHNYFNCCCCCLRAFELFFLDDKHQQIWWVKFVQLNLCSRKRNWFGRVRARIIQWLIGPLPTLYTSVCIHTATTFPSSLN